MCRRTRQVVAFVIGDRSQRNCRRLYRRIPQAYRRCGSYSDFWAAYAKVFKSGRHQSVDKRSGETTHVERWNRTLLGAVGHGEEGGSGARVSKERPIMIEVKKKA